MKIVDIQDLDLDILPTKKIEEFRSFDIYPIFKKDLEFKIDENIDQSKYHHLKNEEFYNIFFINNNIIMENDEIKDNIKIEYGNFENSFNKLYKLNGYLNKKTITLKIIKELKKPLNIINIFQGNDTFFTNSLNIEIDVNNTHILETFYNKEYNNLVINTNRKYIVNDNIKANISKIQTLDNSEIIINYKTILKEHATLNLVNLEYKANLALNIFDTTLDNKYSTFNLRGIIKNKISQRSGNIAFIEHVSENSTSKVKIKHLLDEKAHALFDVSSTVQNKARFSKVLQNSQTILLNDDSKINVNPRLQIFVDELEAAHGASCGTLNKDELYYLCSRGISEKKAKKMIIDSIELDIIKKIKSKTIRKYVKDLKEKFNV